MLTPHPGEMARLSGKTTAEVQQDRVGTARAFAMPRAVTLVLKGERTVIGIPRWTRVDQSHRHAGDGHGRQRRYSHRPDRRACWRNSPSSPTKP